MLRNMLFGVVMGVLTLAAASDAQACERCVQRQLEQLRRHQMVMEELNRLTESGGMLGPEYMEWLTNANQSYQPARYVPRGWEGIERNRIMIDNAYGPNSFVGSMIRRMNQ